MLRPRIAWIGGLYDHRSGWVVEYEPIGVITDVWKLKPRGYRYGVRMHARATSNPVEFYFGESDITSNYVLFKDKNRHILESLLNE